MMPQGNDLMVSAPLNPMKEVRKSVCKSMRCSEKEIKNFMNITLA